mmetsp:Transcript_81683/g.132412  ORF Transcript_81683/g.132412 Transcript_81683/m.132412 type:complete len:160 (+) Transcript_81683:112-591(+)|eukprot:CAMPEP_0179428496 /NCGR_PEP_ID=MMETSP0799-20121207/14160_1 /TAXON_ID=46947 /ORGANISM="Geminigera cryophila, Strain CCMP2564" /LENGTH=159 /DNA_ID=CAMNT_0021204033 /DNA_START=204 /DNA_END=683 /DNA_ORIENTATION=-
MPSLPDIRDPSACKCHRCGISNVKGSTDPNVCAYQAALQNVAYFWLADGNGFNNGNVTWQCCNCARDIPFGVTTLSNADYNKTACTQCRNRPREVINGMRGQMPARPANHLQYQVSRKQCAWTVLAAVIIGSLCVAFFVWDGNKRQKSKPESPDTKMNP